MKKSLITSLQLFSYFFLFMLLLLPILLPWYPYLQQNHPELISTPLAQLPVEITSVIAALIATWLMGLLFKSVQISDFGLHKLSRLPHFIVGTVIGVGMIGITLMLINQFGVLSLNPDFRFSLSVMQFALIGGVSLNAIAQEIVFRGYFFTTLHKKYSSSIAIIVSSLIFVVVHAGVFSEPWPESAIGASNLFLAGVLMSVAYLRTQSLWLPIGLHIGWNLSQALLNLEVTGQTLARGGPLFILEGPTILTGGNIGLEGSILGILGVIAGLILVGLIFRSAPDKSEYEHHP